jgi:hypothetical protein
MGTLNTFSSIPSLGKLTSRWANLKDLIASMTDVFLIGQGDPELFKHLQECQEEYDQLDLLLGQIFLGSRTNPYFTGLLRLAA